MHNNQDEEVKRELQSKMENLQKKIESKNKKHQEILMNKRQAALMMMR